MFILLAQYLLVKSSISSNKTAIIEIDNKESFVNEKTSL
jgi:hypothetical protein